MRIDQSSIQSLDWYDGPIMISGKTNSGYSFIGVWVDEDASGYRQYLCACMTEKQLQNVLNNNMTLFEAFRHVAHSLLLWYWRHEETECDKISIKEALRKDLLPHRHVYYDSAMRHEQKHIYKIKTQRHIPRNDKKGRHKDSLKRFHKPLYDYSLSTRRMKFRRWSPIKKG